MKIAISTCQTGMIESLSAMFSEHEWHILGIMRPRPDWDFHMIVQRQLGRNVYNHYQDEDPVQKVDIHQYDLLIDVAESNDYNPEWREAAKDLDIPRILYLTNPAPDTSLLRKLERFGRLGRWLFYRENRLLHPIFYYFEQFSNYPVIYTNEQLQNDWGLKGKVIHFSHDEWGIGKWIGDDPVMLYGKNGYYTWAKPEGTRFHKLFAELHQGLGKQFEVHDASAEGQAMAELDWRDYVARKRVWFEHDFGSTGRALCQGVVKAMCLGLPVILYKTRICQGWRFIKDHYNGFVIDKTPQIISLAQYILDNETVAKKLSKNMVETYKKHLSWAVAKPRWESAMKEALEQYEKL